MNTKKLTYSAFLVAIAVVCSPFNISLGFAKAFPIQHLINVIAGVTLGPLYAVMVAFTTSFIRVSIGTGTLLAFPGSMIGTLLAGYFYKKTNKISLAFLGEVLGTGILGALLSYPIALLILKREVAMFTFVIPFSISTLMGSFFAILLLKSLEKTRILEKLKLS